MESIHGVDVSWLHRPTNGINSNSPNAPLPQDRKNQDTRSKTEEVPNDPKPNGGPETEQEPVKETKRPGRFSRSNSDKVSAPAIPTGDAKSPTKKSWMSSLTSKLSNKDLKSSGPKSPGLSSQTNGSPAPAQTSKSTSATTSQQPTPKAEEDEAVDDYSGSAGPQSPKAGNPSFLSNAFRRFSSSGVTQAQAGALADKPQCQRRILNVDEGRPRCEVQGLNQAKLRRVSFSVDVEIAGSSRYPAEGDDELPEQLEKKGSKKDKKIKERGEGEALKRPDAVVEEKEKDGVNYTSGEKLPKEDATPETKQEAAAKQTSVPDSKPNPHSESRSKDAKVSQKGSPTLDSDRPPSRSHSSTDPGPPPQAPADSTQHSSKSNDKPTTDPLRIYRRCCQLREAPVLKRISEQLGNPNNVGVEAPGVVTSLNLNRSRLQLPDVICLGDWLAVVPVKKLLFDDANLTDEGVRVVLAGLLAAKPPELNKRKRGRSSPTRLRHSAIHRSPCVIEKLTLKNNDKLTAESWKHICLFLNLCKSIKAIDLSMIPFPHTTSRSSSDSEAASKRPQDIAELLHSSLSKRLGGSTLAELTFGECGLDDYHVSKITAAASAIGLSRLGLAGNNMSTEALKSVASYLRGGRCVGLDLAGNDLHGKLSIIVESISAQLPLQAISLAHCNLEPSELESCFQKLVTLTDFRFLDLSHNRKLLSEKPSALSTLRKYIPQLHLLKRLHLMDISMTPADAIGIAEIAPETRNLAHLNFLENPLLSAVVSASDPTMTEEACALFASLMTAVRTSRTLVCVDIDVPGPEAPEVVRALARQVVAYCLRNMELFAKGDAIRITDAAASLPDVAGPETDSLKDIVGEQGDMIDMPANAKSEDYLVGGQGWVKALSHCLNADELRRMSVNGTSTPTQVMESETGKAKAKEMTKGLLASARAFRTRLEAVLAREEAGNAEFDVLKRLQFLDHTILSIITRFEHEYPETRLPSNKPITSPSADTGAEPIEPIQAYSTFFNTDNPPSDSLQTPRPSQRQSYSSPPSRRGSANDLASFVLASEEAKAHRFGQRFRREVLPPKGQDDVLHGTSRDDVPEPPYAAELRRRMEMIGGDEIQQAIKERGWEAVVKGFADEKQEIRRQSMVGVNGDEQVIEGEFKGGAS